jgi:hypothetical protein
MTKPLHPVAQAVLDATDYQEDWATRISAAATTLRAVVAHTQQRQYGDCWICDANELLAIAAELEAS